MDNYDDDQDEKKLVKVLLGSGIDESCSSALLEIAEAAGYKASYIKADNIIDGELDKSIAAILCGGGMNTNILNDSLGETGRENIKNYVKNGGKYYGICMSAFFAGRKFYNSEDSSITYPGLELYPGMPGGLEGTDDARFEKVTWTDTNGSSDTYKLFYQDGPNFELDNPLPDDAEVEIVGVYEKDGSNAALFVNYGEGCVFVTGPHPEASADWFSANGLSKSEKNDCAHTELAINALKKLVEKK